MYVQKVEQEKVAKERGETKDNRSFIAKYVSNLNSFLLFIKKNHSFIIAVDVHFASSPRLYDVGSWQL